MKVISHFYQEVYDATSLVPLGRVSMHVSVARFIGRPKAARAVGNALNANPFAPQVPCHRIVKSDGRVDGAKMDGSVTLVVTADVTTSATEGEYIQTILADVDGPSVYINYTSNAVSHTSVFLVF